MNNVSDMTIACTVCGCAEIPLVMMHNEGDTQMVGIQNTTPSSSEQLEPDVRTFEIHVTQCEHCTRSVSTIVVFAFIDSDL